MVKLAEDTIGKDDMDALSDWLKTYPKLTKGKLTEEFEEAYSKWISPDKKVYSVFCNSGSSAILLSIYNEIALGNLKEGDKVLVPSVCWITDISPIIQFGLVPVVVDVNLNDLSYQYEQLITACKKHNPKAMILVSVLGIPPNMKDILAVCDAYKMTLIEDICESLGTTAKGKKLGTFGKYSITSLYFGHHMSCSKSTPIPYIDHNGQFRIEPINEIYTNYHDAPEKIRLISFKADGSTYLSSPTNIIRHKLNKKELIKITTKGNREVEITSDHSVFKRNENAIESISGDELQLKDKILTPFKINVPIEIKDNLDFLTFCKNENNIHRFFAIDYDLQDIINFKPKWGTKDYKRKENYLRRKTIPLSLVKSESKELKIALVKTPRNHYIPYEYKVTPELCRLIGYFIAEGSFKEATSVSFSFNITETEYVKDVVDLCKHIFGINAVVRNRNNNCSVVTIENATICVFFKEFLGIKSGSLNLRIPDFIWHTNQVNQKEFLYGCFLGDGTIDSTRVEFASGSKLLINDISYLCSMLGIRGSVGLKTKPQWVTIAKNRNPSYSNGVWSFRLYNLNFENADFAVKIEKHTSALLPNSELIGDLHELSLTKKEVVNYDLDEYVYDFSVPTDENFIGGWQPICLHNSSIEGGMVSTKDFKAYEVLKMLRSHGWNRDVSDETKSALREKYGVDKFNDMYTFYYPSFNVRSTDLQAFIGLRQMDKLDMFVEKRNENYQTYLNKFKELNIDVWLPKNVYYQLEDKISNLGFPIIFRSKEHRQTVSERLANANIEHRPLISGDISKHPFFLNYEPKIVMGDSNSSFIHDCGMYLPNHASLTDKDIETVVRCFVVY